MSSAAADSFTAFALLNEMSKDGSMWWNAAFEERQDAPTRPFAGNTDSRFCCNNFQPLRDVHTVQAMLIRLQDRFSNIYPSDTSKEELTRNITKAALSIVFGATVKNFSDHVSSFLPNGKLTEADRQAAFDADTASEENPMGSAGWATHLNHDDGPLISDFEKLTGIKASRTSQNEWEADDEKLKAFMMQHAPPKVSSDANDPLSGQTTRA